MEGHLEFCWNGVWRTSELDFDRYLRDWLLGNLIDASYRWLEDGVAVYLPRCR